MGQNRLPKKEEKASDISNPDDVEDEEGEDTDSELSEDSEPELPPPSPRHIARMQFLNKERERLERQSQEYSIDSEKMLEWAERMKYHTGAIKNELVRLKAKIAEVRKSGIAGAIAGDAIPGSAGMVAAVAGGAGVGVAAVGGAGAPGAANEGKRPNIPFDVVANKIQRLAKEIERVAGLSASPPIGDDNKEEDKSEKNEGYEPKNKKGKTQEEDHDHDSDPPPPPLLGA